MNPEISLREHQKNAVASALTALCTEEEMTRKYGMQGVAPLLFAVGDGNVIFPEGNAKRYLSEYFTDFIPDNPYREDKRDLRTLSVDADGSVLNGNLYEASILELMEAYQA